MPTHYSGSPDAVRALDAYIKLTRAADSVNERINASLTQHRLTVSQFGVLEALYHLGPLYQHELAAKILRSTGNITHVIDQLEARRLVERQRSVEDRRYIAVHLTNDGRDLIAGILPDHVARVVETFGCLTAQEQETLALLCRKLGLGG